MFGDGAWIEGDFIWDQESKWDTTAVIIFLQTQLLTFFQSILGSAYSMNIVVLEIGCGINVPTLRRTSHSMLERFSNCKLIRINPDYPEAPDMYADRVISIKEKGLFSVQKIDQYMQEMKSKVLLEKAKVGLNRAIQMGANQNDENEWFIGSDQDSESFADELNLSISRDADNPSPYDCFKTTTSMHSKTLFEVENSSVYILNNASSNAIVSETDDLEWVSEDEKRLKEKHGTY